MDKGTNQHALPNQEKWIKLSVSEIRHIFVYYIIIFLFSLAGAIWAVCYKFTSPTTTVNLHYLVSFSLVFGLLGSTFYYIRKLYKSCIQLLVSTVDDRVSVASLGAKIYFYMRPIMGAVLSFIIILGIYGGFFFLQNQPSIDGGKFYIFSAILSFIIGFSNGKVIVRLDHSADKISHLFKFTQED